jgi:hypothetical protein
LKPTSLDPRADAIANLAHLVAGIDHDRTRAIVTAVDPLVLPLFLELASVLFFSSAVTRRKVAIVKQPETIVPTETTMVVQSTTDAAQPFTREQALHDLRELRSAGSGRYLAHRWGIDPATASRWLQGFEDNGVIARQRDGKSKAIVAMLPSPASARKRLGHMAQFDRQPTE